MAAVSTFIDLDFYKCTNENFQNINTTSATMYRYTEYNCNQHWKLLFMFSN